MRTTLKRGIGRAEPNGDGAVPPGLLTPVTHYRRPRRGALHLLGKIFLWMFILVFVAAGALAGGAWLFINQSISALAAKSPEVIAAEKNLDLPVPGSPTTAIVLGYDQRLGADRAMSAR